VTTDHVIAIGSAAISMPHACLPEATDEHLADFFEVHRDTICEWKRPRADVSGAITCGQILADAEVAMSALLLHYTDGQG
jgi:hypothetical protein